MFCLLPRAGKMNASFSDNDTLHGVTELDQCQERTSVYYIIHRIFFIVTFISSVFGNSGIIICLFQFKRLRVKNVNFLTGSLAISNLFIIGLVPFELVEVFYPETSRTLACCLAYHGLVLMLMSSSGGNFIIISFERFLAVMFPFRHRTLVTRFRLKLLIALVWATSIVCAFLPLIGWNNSVNASKTTEISYCTVDKIFPPTMVMGMLCFITLDLLVNLILFVPVMLVACAKANNTRHTIQDRNTRIITKRIAYSFATFSVFWCPFAASTMIALLYDGPLNICLRKWSIRIGLLHSSIDWLFYGLGNESFRNAFKHLILCRSYTIQYS